jgi:hypothetical protein
MTLRAAVAALVAAHLLVAPCGTAWAEPLILSDGRYASEAEYIAGNWKWERAEPRQTMIMRFGRDGSFFYHNLTTDLQHWGSYVATGGNLQVKVTRSCENKGTNCEDRKPPATLEYPCTPVSANVFMSNSERWERMK